MRFLTALECVVTVALTLENVVGSSQHFDVVSTDSEDSGTFFDEVVSDLSEQKLDEYSRLMALVIVALPFYYKVCSQFLEDNNQDDFNSDLTCFYKLTLCRCNFTEQEHNFFLNLCFKGAEKLQQGTSDLAEFLGNFNRLPKIERDEMASDVFKLVDWWISAAIAEDISEDPWSWSSKSGTIN